MQVKVKSPKKIDERIRAMIAYLGLDEESGIFLKQRKETLFKPELDNCHINNMVKKQLCGGAIAYGWVIGEDKLNDVVEAHFYSVWRDAEGQLVDINPRPTMEKRLLFVPDISRKVSYTSYAGRPAIITYERVVMSRGQVVGGIKEKIFIPYSELIYEYGLAKKAQPVLANRP